MAESRHPKDVGQAMEGHAGLRSAERHEMEAVERDEEETDVAIDRAEQEKETGKG